MAKERETFQAGTLQALPNLPNVFSDTQPARKAVVDLIVKLCDDAKQGKVRDEFSAYSAIADLMRSVLGGYYG